MPDWNLPSVSEVSDLSEQLRAEQENNLMLQESMAELELALEDRGWLALSMQAAREFTREGKRRSGALTRILAIANPLVKRGLAIRAGYIWGDGVQISAEDPDVNNVVQAFLDDNDASFSGSQAREEAERSLGTDGDVFRALVTSPLTGRVRVRTIDVDEIEDIICNPEDRDEPWFYLRQYTVKAAGTRYAGITRQITQTRRVLYPALGFVPSARVPQIDGIDVAWDSPVQHVAVNRLDRGFGIGDAYAAIFWARAYDTFLTDWAKLTKSLSRYAWRVTSGTKSKATKAAIEAKRAAAVTDIRGDTPAGATAVTAGNTLEAIPKSGATIDANSGKPLAGMVAAALGVPLTMLLADPGQTGARAVAETLDEPTANEMRLRRSLWEAKDRELFDYVIDQAVKAPRGPLRGTITKDEYGREVITLAGDVDRLVSIDWPSLDKIPLKDIVESIVAADGTDKVPPLIIARLIMVALGVADVDEALDDLTDDDGNFIDPQTSAGDVAVRRFRNGEDAAEGL